MSENKKTTSQLQTAERQENISNRVMERVSQFQKEGSLILPDNYSAQNALQSAWLVLQETETRDKKPVLSHCTRDSIATALLDMVVQGLSVSKKQGYFIAYGDKLEFIRSYFGTVAVAKQSGGLVQDPVANVIYKGDVFEYIIDPQTGRTKIVKHESKLENIDNDNIRGAYAVITRPDNVIDVEVMSMPQIKAAWNQGATKGASPAHKNFADQMAKRTVINRACKMIINSSDDAWLLEGKRDEYDTDKSLEHRDSAIENTGSKQLQPEEVAYEDVTEKLPANELQEPKKESVKEQEEHINGSQNLLKKQPNQGAAREPGF